VGEKFRVIHSNPTNAIAFKDVEGVSLLEAARDIWLSLNGDLPYQDITRALEGMGESQSALVRGDAPIQFEIR
jgi:hypothetical protein